MRESEEKCAIYGSRLDALGVAGAPFGPATSTRPAGINVEQEYLQLRRHLQKLGGGILLQTSILVR